MRQILLLLFITILFAAVHAHPAQAIKHETSAKCGDYYDLEDATDSGGMPGMTAPGACHTNAKMQGESYLNPANPDGTPNPAPSGNYLYNVDIATGADSLAPTGKGDLDHFLGDCKDDYVITKDSTCEEIVDKCLSNEQGGVLPRMKSADEYSGTGLKDFCDQIIDYATHKTLARLEATYEPPTTNGCLPPTKAPNAAIVTPTYGVMGVLNDIYRHVRSADFRETEKLAQESLKTYLSDLEQQNNVKGTQTNPQVLAATSPTVCGEGECPVIRSQQDDTTCFLDPSEYLSFIDRFKNWLDRAISFAQGIPYSEYPITFKTYDPSLGGGTNGVVYQKPVGGSVQGLTSDGTEQKEDVFNLPLVYNYLLGPQLQSADRLNKPLYTQARFGTGEGDDYKIDYVSENNGIRYFGLGHKAAIKTDNCMATRSADEIDTRNCGEAIEELASAATSPLEPGEVEPAPLDASGQQIDWNPEIVTSECKACTLKGDSGISTKLTELLSEVGNATGVPANVILGLMYNESGHWPTKNPPVYTYSDEEIERGVDPACIRNIYCATGPFQILINPANSYQYNIATKVDDSCKKWPGFTKGGDYDIWGHMVNNRLFKEAASLLNITPEQIDPCNLKAAALAAAVHLKASVNKELQGQSATCSAWNSSIAREAWKHYHGTCGLNYCTNAAYFLTRICQPSGSASPRLQVD